MKPKSDPLQLATEIREQLTTISKVKGIYYAGIVESVVNLININVAFGMLVPKEQEGNAKAIFGIADGIIGTAVSLMVGLWKTSGFKPNSKEDEQAMYDDCAKIVLEINTDIRMIQKKQQEYASNDSH